MADLRPGADDAELLEASARGDREAFGVFYGRHLSAVLAALLAETRDPELAGDLAAEVFAAALLGAGRYRPDQPTALPWLGGIARNKARGSRRHGRAEDRARRRLGIPREQLDDHDLERVEELAAESGWVVGLVDQLPDSQRFAVRARVIEERDYREIAAELGSSEPAVRQQVSRALSWLRTRMEERNR